jgi:hypothetical protein
MGVGGKAIPPDKIENIQSDAKFILLVEKEAAYIRITMSVERCSLSLSRIVLMSILLPRILIVSSSIPLRNRVQEDRLYCHNCNRYGCSEGLVGFIVYFHFLAHR